MQLFIATSTVYSHFLNTIRYFYRISQLTRRAFTKYLMTTDNTETQQKSTQLRTIQNKLKESPFGYSTQLSILLLETIIIFCTCTIFFFNLIGTNSTIIG